MIIESKKENLPAVHGEKMQASIHITGCMRCAPAGLGLRHISLHETSHTTGTLCKIKSLTIKNIIKPKNEVHLLITY